MSAQTPGQAVYEAHQSFMIRCFPGIAPIAWGELSGEAQREREGIAEAGLTAALLRADAAAVLDDDLDGDAENEFLRDAATLDTDVMEDM